MASNTARSRAASRSPAGLSGLVTGRLVAFWLLASMPVTPAMAQHEPAETPAVVSVGTASLAVEGRPVTTLATSALVDGPRFALAPIAAALGVQLRVGPLGDSHTLILDDRQIILGPDQTILVTMTPDGRTESTSLRRMPVRDAQGLKVSLETLNAALGEPLNYSFTWRQEERVLEASRPEARFLQAAVTLRHQFLVSLVEIELSEAPRYRVDRSPGILDIHLIGDRFETPVARSLEADVFVEEVVVTPERLRLRLAAGAVADEPRLLTRPSARLVIEVFQGSAQQTASGRVERRPRRRASGIRTIALDPGHGGEETGAIGPAGTAEAELALLVARALRLQLERRLPVKVILTRERDVDVPLETRTAIANENQADLFISLHFNSSFGSSPRGAETYFLSREASDQLAAALAEAENETTSGGRDPEVDLRMILWDLAQSQYLAKSQRFANLVQEELNVALGLRDRGVKQAPFTVLMGAKMPAVLVELGFLSNPQEEEKLKSSLYRAELVDALVRAVIRFKRQIEGRELAQGGAAPGQPGDGKGSR